MRLFRSDQYAQAIKSHCDKPITAMAFTDGGGGENAFITCITKRKTMSNKDAMLPVLFNGLVSRI